jgi:hypothetical protein
MTEKKREGFLRRLFGAGKPDCCSVTIEEVGEETQDTSSPACCGPGDEAQPSKRIKSEKPRGVGSATRKPIA